MITFAEELSQRIKGKEEFWSDVEVVSSAAIQFLLPQATFLNGYGPIDEARLWRLLRSASALSQSGSEKDKGLAQDLALFISLVARSVRTKTFACDLFAELGNHPGVEQLLKLVELPDEVLLSSIKRAVLRAMNTVPLAGSNYALTDFQYGVWSRLSQVSVGAVSAPTSAGKSFVVMEHLCKRAINSESLFAVFIAPTRALLAEIHGKLSDRLKDYSKSIRVSTIPTLDQEERPKQIFVLTQERLQVLLAITDLDFDLVIADEAQGIGDDSRGMILQDCLENIASRSDGTQFLFLAPGASGFSALAEAASLSGIVVEETELSPVVQNRIVVSKTRGEDSQLELSLLANDRRVRLGVLKGERGFGNAKTVLAAVSLELGKGGGSLVYGTGPADAENVAAQIASDLPAMEDEALENLSKFVKEHVHSEYSLVEDVKRGVGFHYGKMPSLLREALEQAFKDGGLNYLVCTTTLFQGVNLPARNVFISTPTRGKKAKLDAAALWNFAGRAGRLGEDIVGNVFLIDYDKWESKPFTTKARFTIEPSFRKVVATNASQVAAFMRSDSVENLTVTKANLETAAGLMIARAAKGTLSRFVKRNLGDVLSQQDQGDLMEAAKAALDKLDLPVEVLTNNWTVNPFGQARLLKRFREKIAEGKAEDLIPIHPDPWKISHSRYVGIFARLNREVLGMPTYSKFNTRLASDALAWMSGHPLPLMIKARIDYVKKTKKRIKIDTEVRNVFDFIEDHLRFKYVQLGRCYVDLLRFALNEAGDDELARSIYDFPLALELGVSSVAGQAFIELGLSRITSAVLEGMIPDSSPTVERAKEWLGGLTLTGSKLSRVIWDELARRELVKVETPAA